MIVSTEKWTDIGRVLLVATDPELRNQVEQALPAAETVQEETGLAGLLRTSRENFNLVLLRIPTQEDDLVPALRSYRHVDPSVRIILLAKMFEEPLALGLTQRGLADDYLILPLHKKELDLALRKCFPRSTGRSIEPMGAAPYSRLISEPANAPAASDPQQLLIREVTELINSAELGLQELLERVCWSAVFLCKARGAKITFGEHTACVGSDEYYDLVMPLMENGKEIGQIELATGAEHAACSVVAGYLDQLIPDSCGWLLPGTDCRNWPTPTH